MFAPFATLVVPDTVLAEPTDVTVRVLAKDSKFVGTSMGGMRIVLRDAQTGEILTTGVTQGGTGDTALIMHKDKGSRAVLSDDSAAKFTATLDLDEPRLIEIEAYGPLGQPQAAARVLATQWVVPGRHLTGGDGFVLHLPGIVVDVLAPPAHVRVGHDAGTVDVRANVVMMCGCPIEPGGLWDADKLEVKAIVKHNGEEVKKLDLDFAGETSQFAVKVPIGEPGFYEVIVYAHDPGNGNTGLDRTTFIVTGG
ncbi:MAG: hypothetical protein FJX44_08455 [Alphaproteobacteria bacterium]|nr:hypothetical protein [Alphaproteobacteria bacterium]